MDIYPNFTLVFQIANFLFLLFILNIILYRPIRKILGQRGDEVVSFQEMIEDFQTRSTEGAKTLEENMADARSQGFKEKEGLKGAGMEEEKVMLQQGTMRMHPIFQLALSLGLISIDSSQIEPIEILVRSSSVSISQV